MRRLLVLILILMSGAAAVERRHPYRDQWDKRVASKDAVIRAGAGATVNHLRNAPHEWGRGPIGFGKRVGSALATQAVKGTVEIGVAAARHEDLRYHRSTKKGFRPRLQHALVSTVVTRKTTNGRKTVAGGRIAGNVTSGFVSRLWQPARLHTVSSGAATAGIGLGMEAGSNTVQEFWPEIRHPGRHRRHHVRRRS